MKLIKASQSLAIPEGVELSVKARKIRVKGPRGAFCSLDLTVAVAAVLPVMQQAACPAVGRCAAWACTSLELSQKPNLTHFEALRSNGIR